MNTSSIEVHHTPRGWLALYSPCRTTRHIHVTDAKGQAIPYPTEEKAKIAAYEALLAAENRIEAIRFDPSQIVATPKFYEPRSGAGKKAFAERRLREAMKELSA